MMTHKRTKANLQIASVQQSTARLLGIKFLDHLMFGSRESEDVRGFVSVMEYEN